LRARSERRRGTRSCREITVAASGIIGRVAVVVRPAELEDATGIAGVHVAGWQAGYAGLLPPAYLAGLSVGQRAERWGTILADAHAASTTLVAELDGAITGFASVGPSRDDDAARSTGELWGIYVDPAHWGTGVGHALHEAALQELRDAGATRATLWVLQGNQRAAAFYERHGWTADGATKTDWRDDVRLDELRYRRSL
jgi:GNAT superfamily N-acetyltransferase